jgi:hypothetical protein
VGSTVLGRSKWGISFMFSHTLCQLCGDLVQMELNPHIPYACMLRLLSTAALESTEWAQNAWPILCLGITEWVERKYSTHTILCLFGWLCVPFGALFNFGNLLLVSLKLNLKLDTSCFCSRHLDTFTCSQIRTVRKHKVTFVRCCSALIFNLRLFRFLLLCDCRFLHVSLQESRFLEIWRVSDFLKDNRILCRKNKYLRNTCTYWCL